MDADQAVTLITTIASDAVHGRIIREPGRGVHEVRDEIRDELYAALVVLLSLPPAPPGPAPALSSSSLPTS